MDYTKITESQLTYKSISGDYLVQTPQLKHGRLQQVVQLLFSYSPRPFN